MGRSLSRHLERSASIRPHRSWRIPLAVWPVPLALLALLLSASGMHAQVRRPADERPEPPPFEQPEEAVPRLLLPPVPPPRRAPEAPQAPRAFVREFIFQGNTAFSDAQLGRVVAAWSGRRLSGDEIRAARDAVTLHYASAGFVTSGARLPDQSLRDGRVLLEIVEGSPPEVRIAGTHWFRPAYLRRRLLAGAGAPLNALGLEQTIRLLQQDPALARLDAELRPGARPGESVLNVRVQEALPLGLELATDNHETLGAGEYAGDVHVRHENALGLADRLSGRFRGAEGLLEAGGRYDLPLPPFETRLGVHGEWTRSEVVEDEFADLDIRVGSATIGVSVRQPLLWTPETKLSLGLIGEWRDSETELLGTPFDFPGSGSQNGEATLAALRFAADWSWRDRVQVVAARSLLSWGVDALGATTAPGSAPDGRFVAWLAQLQGVRRLDAGPLPLVALLRVDLQLANDALLSFERLPIGGHASVRGYRENQIVRDQGVIGSLELRVPLWRQAITGRSLVELAPFFDVGYGFDRDRASANRETLSSAGLGLRLQPLPQLYAELYWGHAFHDLPGADGLQGHGVHFQVRLSPF